MINVTVQRIDNGFLVASMNPAGSTVNAFATQEDAVAFALELINEATFPKENK